MRDRETDQNRILYAATALAASSVQMHLSPDLIARHAWNVADAMIKEGQDRGFLPSVADEPATAPEADTSETTTPAVEPTTPPVGA